MTFALGWEGYLGAKEALNTIVKVPYHICKMRVKVLYVSDHWEESRIFWPRALI